MSRSGDSGTRRFIAFMVGVALVAPLAAEGPPASVPEEIWLSDSARQQLRHIQQGWVQWSNAYYQGDEEGVATELEAIVELLEQTGFQRLPDLALAAAARAVESAREGDFERALWALTAAERLDPDRPEISFARATVARSRGSTLEALRHELDGYLRIGAIPSARSLWLHDLGHLLLVAGLLAGGLFVLLMAATKGGGIVGGLWRRLSEHVPPSLRIPGLAVALLWPLVLPMGIVLLILFWSVLLWSRCSTSERAVLVSLWLLAASTPALVAAQQHAVAATLSPPGQAVDAVSESRLYGAMFNDLAVLVETLDDEIVVTELIGDVHRMLGQWDRARSLYEEVVEARPNSHAALLNLGAYYFRKHDIGTALDYFERAAAVSPESAAAYFNLSQAYSEAYLFDEHSAALSEARRLDEPSVRTWIQDSRPERVVTVNGSVVRHDELEALVRRGWRSPTLAQLPLLAGIAMSVTVALLLCAIGFAWMTKDWEMSRRSASVPSGWRQRLLRVLVPGYRTAEAGAGGRCYAAVFVPSFLVASFAWERFGYQIAWGIDPGSALPVLAAIVGLASLLALRAALDWQVHRL